MQAELKFNLPEESRELDYALNGYKYRALLSEFDTRLRNMAKYEGIDSMALGEVRAMLSRMAEEEGLNFYD